MNKRTTDIVAYLTWIGLMVAFVAGDRHRSKFHLNQALVLAILSAAWTVIYRVAYVVLNIVTFGLARRHSGAHQCPGHPGTVGAAGAGPGQCHSGPGETSAPDRRYCDLPLSISKDKSAGPPEEGRHLFQKWAKKNAPNPGKAVDTCCTI